MTSSISNTGAKVLLGVIASLTAVAPIYCRAAETTAPVSRNVSYAGIDLNTPEGARALYGRLKSAARSLCGSSDPVYVAASWVYRGCIEDALARAVLSANRPLISQGFVSDYGIAA